MSNPLPWTEDEYRAESARRHLADFVRLMWPVIEPETELRWNWHIDAICEHLEAVGEPGGIKRLLINIPPGHMKSLLVSVMWPAWQWVRRPQWRAIFGSYAQELAIRDAVKSRSLIASDTYKSLFSDPAGWELTDDQNVKSYYRNTVMGERLAVGVGGKVTGFRGDCIVCDDPLNAVDATSDVARKGAIEWWDKAMSTRLNDPRTGSRVLIMQRLHEDDLAGHVLRSGGYEALILPSEYDPKRRASTCGGDWQDPRTTEGELLFPEMFPREVLDGLKRDLGSDGFAAQHDQSPQPAEGGTFKVGWWRRYRQVPRAVDGWAGSIDCTFKDTSKADYVVAQVWARASANRYLVWEHRERLSFTNTVALLLRARLLFPEVGEWLVEDKANGPAVLDVLRDKLPGLIAVDPGNRGKEARAMACTPQVEAGQVWLPEDTGGNVQVWRAGEWHDTGGWAGGATVDGFVSEHAAFPKGRNDDQVDATTQMLNRWRSYGAAPGEGAHKVIARATRVDHARAM